MNTTLIPLESNSDKHINEEDLYTSYYSFEMKIDGTSCKKYVLRSLIESYINDPISGLHAVTSEKLSLLMLACYIDNVDLMINLLEIPEYDIHHKDDNNDDITSLLLHRGTIYYYYGRYPNIIDLLLKRNVSVYDLVPFKEIPNVARRCFKAGELSLLNCIIDDDILNNNIHNEYKYIMTMFISNINMHKDLTDYCENDFLNFFDKFLDLIPYKGLSSNFITMCHSNLTSFIILSLSKKKVDPHYVDGNGYNSILCAARNNNITLAEILLNLDVNPDCKSCYGEYPIMYAVRYNNLKMVQLLKQCGASIKVIDVLHRTPYMFAVELGRTDLLQYLSTKPVSKSGLKIAHEASKAQLHKYIPFKSKKKKDLNYNDHECPICLEKEPNNLFLVPCGHGPIGAICINKFKNKTCPFCHAPFSDTLKVHVI